MSDHVLHVTKVRDDTSDDVEWTIECPGGSSCHIWYDCRVEGCTIPTPYADDGDGQDFAERHGVEHQYIEGDWMTESDQCAALVTDVVDSVFEIARDRGVGDWPVYIDYEGDGTWWLHDLTDVRKDGAR
jgi:hypothetical protein